MPAESMLIDGEAVALRPAGLQSLSGHQRRLPLPWEGNAVHDPHGGPLLTA